jgi:MerR family transcriptional regulator, copper efflux regulator
VAGERPLAADPPEDEARGLLQVGQLAKIAGKTVRAIHLYEDLGLLRPTERSKGRFRLYEREAVERVRWISKLQSAGFSLPELRRMLLTQEGVFSAKEAASSLALAYEAKLREVQVKLAELHRIERELVTSLAYLDACQSACDSHLGHEACASCDRHLDQPEPPPLVMGAFVQ